ncbi:MAG: serine--tRNA ligase, partial [Nitrososphaeraceae archaeon]
CKEYQARRLSIRYRDRIDQETQFVHTLNSTLVATERTMVAILDNYQTADGGVIIPEALRKYMSDISEIRPK